MPTRWLLGLLSQVLHLTCRMQAESDNEFRQAHLTCPAGRIAARVLAVRALQQYISTYNFFSFRSFHFARVQMAKWQRELLRKHLNV